MGVGGVGVWGLGMMWGSSRQCGNDGDDMEMTGTMWRPHGDNMWRPWRQHVETTETTEITDHGDHMGTFWGLWG